MATTVYIWPNSRNDVGHASIAVDTEHLSFWPRDSAGAKNDIKLKEEHEPGLMENYDRDRRLERRDATYRVKIEGLNEKAMLELIEDIRRDIKSGRGRRYNMVKQNCSTIVAMVLEIGAGEPAPLTNRQHANTLDYPGPMAFALRALIFSGTVKMWTPLAVLMYAQQLASRQLA